jgi:hypothetical protein
MTQFGFEHFAAAYCPPTHSRFLFDITTTQKVELSNQSTMVGRYQTLPRSNVTELDLAKAQFQKLEGERRASIGILKWYEPDKEKYNHNKEQSKFWNLEADEVACVHNSCLIIA